MEPYLPRPGATLDEIDTPALLLDHVKLTANIRRMAEVFHGRPARLRPHSKTHKCVEIACAQIEHGAVGITCAKLGEAEVMAESGIDDILIANQVVGQIKIRRLMDLARRCRVAVAVDDHQNVRDLSEAATAAGLVLRCLVEVDIGMGRCGVEPGEPALRLAELGPDPFPTLAVAALHAPQTLARLVRRQVPKLQQLLPQCILVLLVVLGP